MNERIVAGSMPSAPRTLTAPIPAFGPGSRVKVTSMTWAVSSTTGSRFTTLAKG